MASGKSLSVQRKAFITPPTEPEHDEEQDELLASERPARQVNVYDVVAGRVSTRGFLTEKNISSNSEPLRPEEVLFRRQNAPTRYAENDIYFANESIPADNPLPDSDLLKAIHTYTSDFYDNATQNRGQTDWRSMDETALIAMGILLEEAAKESLGETGDMSFVEGEEISNADGVFGGTQTAIKPGRKRSSRRSSTVLGDFRDIDEFRPKGKRKKRRNE